MKTKKAQSEIITTVLIILLVLAAVVIVWQVVQGTVKKGGEAVSAGSACIGINLNIDSVSYTAGTATIKYTRGADNLGNMTSIKALVVDGTGDTKCTIDDSINVASSLSQKTISVVCNPVLVSGTYTAKIAPKIGSNQCDIASTKDFTV